MRNAQTTKLEIDASDDSGKGFKLEEALKPCQCALLHIISVARNTEFLSVYKCWATGSVL